MGYGAICLTRWPTMLAVDSTNSFTTPWSSGPIERCAEDHGTGVLALLITSPRRSGDRCQRPPDRDWADRPSGSAAPLRHRTARPKSRSGLGLAPIAPGAGA